MTGDRTCPKCSSPVPAGQRFCGSCGARLERDGRGGRRWLLALISVPVLAVLLVAGYIYARTDLIDNLLSESDGCTRQDVTAYAGDADALMDRWSDAYDLASSTGRIALSGPVASLQEVRRQYAELEPPECLTYSHDMAVKGMDRIIAAFIAFMSDKPNADVEQLFTEAEKYFTWSGDGLEAALREMK